MSKLKLVMGSRNLSSWSLRPWFFLRCNELEFDEVVIGLDRDDSRAQILQHSPSAKVPVLVDGDVRVWESLAICEHLAEKFAIADAWPQDPVARGYARSVAAEMHSGFAALRRELPFDATRRPESIAMSQDVARDIARIRAIWREARNRFGSSGVWLFGRFGIADAMFAPVAVRFHAYAVPLDGPEYDYAQRLLNARPMRQWLADAALEKQAAAPPAVLELPMAATSAPIELPVSIRSHILPP